VSPPPDDPPPIRYALRRTLPPHSFRGNLDELLDEAGPAGIDEVIVIVDPEELSHGHTPLEWIDEALPRLETARDELRAAGIEYSLNPWTTLGHGDRGRPPLPGMRSMVGHDGSRSVQSPCPLDEVWRGHLREAWSRLASTRPRVFWVEDDIRFFNHAPVRFGCFCDEHLRRFAELAGRGVGREELVEALLRPGEPHPWRALWLALQREIGTELAGFLGDLVRAASPETRLGLMSSGPRAHAADGRDWHAFAEALGGGRGIVSRPTMGCYDEGWARPRDLVFSKDSILLTRHVLPPGTPDLTEVEGVHFGPYAQSARTLGLKLGITFACGASGATLNTFDHLGTPMSEDRGVLDTLAALRPLARELGARPPGRFAGVRLFFHEDAAARRHLRPGDDLDALTRHGFEAVQLFELHGIATTYDESPVAALVGESARALEDHQLEALLAGGLYLDGEAATILATRGFAAEIGLETIGPATPLGDPLLRPSGPERWEGGGSDPGGLLSALLPSFSHDARIHPATPTSAALVVAHLLDNDLQPRVPAMIAFENDRGGRVVCHLWELASAWGDGFKGSLRARQLRWAVRWLTRGAPPLITRGDPLALGLWRKTADRHLLAAFNLSYDSWPSVRWELACSARPTDFQRLTAEGTWSPADELQVDFDGRTAHVHWPHPLAFGDSVHYAFHPAP